MKTDWNRVAIVAAQGLVVVVLAGLVSAGHNSGITDGLLAVCGSISGIVAYQLVKRGGMAALIAPWPTMTAAGGNARGTSALGLILPRVDVW